MTQDEQKRRVAQAALAHVFEHQILGIGTGSTVNYFIDTLAASRIPIEACVASSKASFERLKAHKLPVLPLTSVPHIDIYFDGADECDDYKRLLKGGGGALTGEKIVAASSLQFICLIDESKRVARLGQFPVVIEVIPMARSLVGRQVALLGGNPVFRENTVTDYGNHLLDVYQLDLSDLMALDTLLNNIPGVVSHGIFARQPADLVLLMTARGLETF